MTWLQNGRMPTILSHRYPVASTGHFLCARISSECGVLGLGLVINSTNQLIPTCSPQGNPPGTSQRSLESSSLALHMIKSFQGWKFNCHLPTYRTRTRQTWSLPEILPRNKDEESCWPPWSPWLHQGTETAWPFCSLDVRRTFLPLLN